MFEWQKWIERNWKELCAGKKLCVAQHFLPHPTDLPDNFKQVDGWPANQRCDFALALEDGSRIHVQCYVAADGIATFCVHRDRWDPHRDLVSFALHALFETPVGLAVGTGLLLGFLSRPGR